jgi:hypothetical protein
MRKHAAVWFLLFLLFNGAGSLRAEVTDLLFVVANSGSLTAGESSRKTGFEMNGYSVTLIDDGASQASFDSATAANNVAYISPDVVSTTLGTKLKNTTIGVACEQWDLADEFGFCSTSVGTSSKTFLAIANNTHYITYGQSLGDLTILTSSQTLARRTGTLATGVTNLASVEVWPGNDDPGLLVLDKGAALYGGGNAAGRRVLLPVGSTWFSVAALNSAGQTIFLRSLEWAARPNPSLGSVLLPVQNTGSLTTQEKLKQMQLDVWGYDVTLIDDDATQASYNTAFSGKLAVYLPKDASAASIGTKLTNCPIGVVSESYGLSDELGLTSTSAGSASTSVTIADNAHYITSPFAAGALTIFTSSQTAATLTGTIAPGLQTLGSISGAKSLCVVESGGVLYTSTTAAGRRVQLPWGGSSFDFATLNASGKLLMRRAVEWAAATPGIKVLMVVGNSGSLTTQELARKTLLESWGYSINIIDDDATQANFDLATAANSIAYVPESVAASSLGSKLYSTALGVVNEDGGAMANLGIATSYVSGSQTSLSIVDANHYITSSLGAGTFSLYSSGQNSVSLSGSSASGIKIIGQWGGAGSLGTIELGARLTDGATAAGRRVQLPWGDSGFTVSALNTSGQTILRRSLQWAGGLIGHWKLDETSGTSASDSSPYSHIGTLSGGMTFAGQSVAGKVGKGLNFNGTSHYVSIANTSALQLTNAMSISAWIKGGTWGSGTTVNTILRKGDANPNNYQLSVANGKLEALLDGSDDYGYKGSTALATGQWYHVAMTWDGSYVRLYVNGASDNTPAAKSAPIGTDARALYIGGRIGSTDFFDGILDDVRLYNYALGSSEIAALKGLGASGVHITKWKEVK